MSEDALEYIALQWASRIHDRPLPDKLEGVYDAEHNEIILSDKLSPVQRRCVLAHEISHAGARPMPTRSSGRTLKPPKCS